MDCEKALEVVYAYLDGAVDEWGRQELMEHCHVCPDCLCVLEFERKIKDYVRDQLGNVVVPESLYRKTARIFDNA